LSFYLRETDRICNFLANCCDYARKQYKAPISFSPEVYETLSKTGSRIRILYLLTGPIGKKPVKQQYLLHMYSQRGELRPTSGWDLFGSLGPPTNFNGYRVLPSLLQRRRSPEVNQSLHDVWTSPAWLVHYIYIFGGCCPWQNFARCKIHFTSKSSVRLYCQRYCTALQQQASAKFCGVVQGMELRNFRRGHHLYSTGRPSRWASAHIVVSVCFVSTIA